MLQASESLNPIHYWPVCAEVDSLYEFYSGDLMRLTKFGNIEVWSDTGWRHVRECTRDDEVKLALLVLGNV